MLLVKTYLAPSNIEGMGLFAGEDIRRGEMTWKYTPGFDLEFSQEELSQMPEMLQDFIKTYAALSKISNKYILGSDNVRFTNHSSNPNLESVQIEGEREKIARAKTDIRKGEEMTIDYKGFDKNDALSDAVYLK